MGKRKLIADETNIMSEMLKTFPLPPPPKRGSLIEGVVVNVSKNKILIDIDGIRTGVITGKEIHDSLDTVKHLQVGDKVYVYIIEEENEDGLMVLSLRKAGQERMWQKFIDAYDNATTIDVKANEANKGGLLLDMDGIKGFIPVSQLAPMHYPRVDGADPGMILTRLQELVKIPLQVKIINLDKENGKLILSEKAAFEDQRQNALGKLNIGEKVKGTISGLVKFGIFVTFGGLEGLVHISEIAWGHVDNPGNYGRLGDEIEALVIGIEGDKISLSMKRLTKDPWLEATKKFKTGQMVDGEVNRITPFGVFVKLDEEINGLIHFSEFGDEAAASKKMKVGDKVNAKIIAIDPDEHRIGLSLKEDAKVEGEVAEEATQEIGDEKELKAKKKADEE
ncbi:TPA: 30S ribosomal protein S1 [Candidatus Peregrinibacteria bacterium]|nr:30S ribosomal protein S1 [Candidatus Peregrinibacteria bacterium]